MKNTVSFLHHSSFMACFECLVSVSPCLSFLTQRSRQAALPPTSNRTLHHTSFLPLYLAVDSADRHRTDCNNQPGESRSPACCFRGFIQLCDFMTTHFIFSPVHPIIPAELFYCDPSMSRGRRIPNIVSDLRASNPTCIQSCMNQQPWDESLEDTNTRS